VGSRRIPPVPRKALLVFVGHIKNELIPHIHSEFWYCFLEVILDADDNKELKLIKNDALVCSIRGVTKKKVTRIISRVLQYIQYSSNRFSLDLLESKYCMLSSCTFLGYRSKLIGLTPSIAISGLVRFMGTTIQSQESSPKFYSTIQSQRIFSRFDRAQVLLYSGCGTLAD
jgi:hypothetical protein